MKNSFVRWMNLVDDGLRSATWAALDDEQRKLVSNVLNPVAQL
jgi:hypothetical protein